MNNISIQELKQKTAFLSFFLVLLAFTAKANPIDLRQAREVGARFINANTRMRSNANDLRLATTYNTTIGTSAFHVFNTANGFVIVAADDCATPILGYSDEGRPFDPNDIPVQMEEYLQGFVEQIQYGVENHIQPDENTVRQWNMVMATGRLNDNRATNAVEPLLTERWDQGCYYNALCPEDNRGPCGHALVGCVATAMGQIMHYWGYPNTGSGSHSYTPSGYPQQTVEFWQTNYDWPNMPDALSSSSSSTQINAVATLLWHCGVAVNMMYGTGSSGAFSQNVPGALTEYFNYSLDLYGQNKGNNATWLNLVKSNLDIGRPLYYSASGAGGQNGHAFVCDGYDANDYLHFNWGWSGNYNNYFALTAIYAGGHDFNYNHYAIFDIHPYEGTEAFAISTGSNPTAGGTTSGDGSYNYGQTCVLTATPDEDYIFANWTKDGRQVSSNPSYQFTVRGDAHYVANFTRTNYTEVVVGEGTETSDHLPFTSTNPYSFSQQIYLADEINASGYITDISFYYQGTSTETLNFDIGLYLKHTQKEAFSSESDWESLTSGDLYFSGTYTIDGTPGWKRITLDSPFEYNGTDNLVISIDNNTGYGFGDMNWQSYSCINAKSIYLFGEEFNYNPYSLLEGTLYNGNNQITLIFQVTHETDFVVSPNPISLGFRPSGCWMPPFSVEVRNIGRSSTITSIESTHSFFSLDLSSLSFPFINEYDDDFGFQISTGTGSGAINASLLIHYGDGQTKETELNAIAYEPVASDVWETAPEVTTFPFTPEHSSPFQPLYDNYRLPNTDIPDGPDAVYKIVLNEEVFLSASVTNGDNGKVALYSENFQGQNGPDVDNNYDSNNPSSDWLYYAENGGLGYLGHYGDWYWGIMIPAEMLQPYTNNWLTKVALFESPQNNLRSITLNIYLGGTSAPENLVLTQEFMPQDQFKFHEIVLNSDILIDGTQNLWITFHQIGDIYPASYYYNTGDPNGRWISLDGVNWTDSGNYTWSIKGFVTNAIGDQGVIGSNQQDIEQMPLLPGTYYLAASSTSENWSLEIEANPMDCPEAAYNPSPAPSSANLNYSSVQLSWILGEGTTEYKLQYGKTPNCEYTLVTWTDSLANNYTFAENLDWNTTYYWKVCERNSTCPHGIESPVWSFTTQPPVLTPRSITAEVYPSGGTINGIGTYTDGSTCTLTAIPTSGYVFKRWTTDDGLTLSTNPSYSFEVKGDYNLIAIFASTANISFADNNVKEICVSQWDTNGDGELNYSEAADVIDLTGFFAKRNIISFDELQHFTGLTSLRYTAFYSCQNMVSIVIPRFVSIIATSPYSYDLPGESAFFETFNLESITVVDENMFFDSRDNCNAIIRTIDNKLIVGCKNTVIPNTVTSIEHDAFAGCKYLYSINLPSSLVSIDRFAFYRSGLLSVVLPNSLVSLEKMAFRDCNSLTSVTIPSSLTQIGTNPFSHCQALNQIIVESSNPVYDSRNGCNAIIETQTNQLICGCAGTVIPNTVTSIGEAAFYACTNSLINIPNSVTSIGSKAFGSCENLLTLTIPRNVVSIGDFAFSSCSSMDYITVLAETPPILGENVFQFLDMSQRTIYVPCSTIPSYVSASGWNTFPKYKERMPYDLIVTSADPIMGNVEILYGLDCSDDTAKVLATPELFYQFVNWTENGVIVSTETEFEFVLESDRHLTANFVQNGNLDDPILFADSLVKSICVTNWDTNQDGELSYNEALAVTDLGLLFKSTNISSFNELAFFRGLTTVSSSAFYRCESLTGITIPNTVTTIENNAFSHCTNLVTIILPNSVTSIGGSAFWNCYSLSSISLSNSLFSIGDLAFRNCSNLTSLFIPSSVHSIGLRPFVGCTSLEEIVVDEENLTYDSRDNCNAIINTRYNRLETGCKETIIPNTITVIGAYAFYNVDITTLVLPNSVREIKEFAFNGCQLLVSIFIPQSVNSIHVWAFNNCSSVESIIVAPENVTYDSRNNCNAIIATNNNTLFLGCMNTIIPESVITIGEDAFSGCTNLTEITIPNSVTSIGKRSFSNCTNLSSIVIPNSVTSIGINSFESSGLNSITISNSITSIPQCAFRQCNNLSKIQIPNSVTSIGSDAFRRCYGLQEIVLPSSLISIDDGAFCDCNSLAIITSRATTPPLIQGFDYTFYRVNPNIPVYVPCGSSEAYSNDGYWNNFTNYHESQFVFSVNTSNPVFGSVNIIQDPDCQTGITKVQAIPNPDCVFLNWTMDSIIVSTDANYEFILEEDTYLTASFAAIDDWSQPIIFADSVVKSICIANWDTNGDGELSRYEAVAVTNIANVFESNSNIVSFDELRFFTGLTTIPRKAFQYCTQLSSIVLPHTITSIDHNSFDRTKLTSITIPNSVLTIGLSFQSCMSLTSIILSNSLVSIYDNAFAYCRNLSSITCLATTPPSIQSRSFYFVNTSIPVYVPCGALDAYSNAANWNAFTNFHEISSFDFSVISADDTMGSVAILQEPSCETEAVIQAIPNEGYAFHSWRKNGILVSTEPTYSFMLTEDSQYTAYFTLQESTVYITAIASPTNGGTVTGAGSYELGAVCTLAALPNEGYGFVHWREGSETVSTESNYSFQVTGNRNLAAIFVPEGALPGTLNGVFSVNDSTQVRFSQGNLQYIGSAATPYWKFADHQWDILGASQNGSSQTIDRDLFGWGTSGYDHGAVCYQPWSTSTVNSDYHSYGSSIYNLYDMTGQADWGYNAISNGGNTENIGWRTPTTDEWDYIFNTRTASTVNGIANARYAKAKVAGVQGMILFPDNYTHPSDVTPPIGINSNGNAGWNGNNYTMADFTIMESNGAVFLPASGDRSGNIVIHIGTDASYWSSSCSDSNNAYHLLFYSGNIVQRRSIPRKDGDAVRLIIPVVNTNPFEINALPNPSEGGTVSGAGTYNEGGTCTLTATANDGYTFVNWTKNGIEVSTSPTYSFTVTENVTLVANFSLDNPSPYHWNVNVNEFANNMTTIGVIEIDGQEQFSTTLEVGAFCHGTCRGREKPIYIEAFNRYLMFLTLYGNDGDTLSFRVFDHAIGQELNKTCSSDMVFNTNAIIGSPDVPHIYSFVSGQTSTFPEGWLWWSTYVEQNGINGLQMLEDGLGSNGEMIKSQGNGFVMNSSIGLWYGTLNSIENEATYLVDVNAPTVVEINGGFASPTDHPITILPGWNWIGFPSSTAISFADAFAGFTPTDGDQVKSQNGFSQYMEIAGYGGLWYGGLEAGNLTPGMGLMYKSMGSGTSTLVYPNAGRSVENLVSKEKHWTNDIHAYPNNMTVMAVVELDGVELNSDRYELAAFANGECRGSAKLTFVEPINRYMAFLTISGDEATELSFGLYDSQAATERFDCSDILAYSTDAIVGKLDEPMIVRFNGTNSIDEIERNLHIYPNPVSCGEHVSITLSIDSKVHIEIIDALGTKVFSETTAQAPAYILAPSTPGVFTIRITVGGKGVYNRKLIVK